MVDDPTVEPVFRLNKEVWLLSLTYDEFVCFDLGDTLMIEETEQKDSEGVTLQADLINGMADLIRHLHDEHVLLGLIADTKVGTYRNVLAQHALWDYFGVFSISDELGVTKPHPRMFEYARTCADQLGWSHAHCLMVGNNFDRDIAGAKAAGFDACWFHWNSRYPGPSNPTTAGGIAESARELHRWIEDWLVRARKPT